MVESEQNLSLQFATISKEGLVVYTGPPDVKRDDRFPSLKCSSLQYSKDGKLLAVLDSNANEGRVTIFDSYSAEEKAVISQPGILFMHFSPKGTYVLTWHQYSSSVTTEENGNLVVWSIATAQPVKKFIQKNFSKSNWPSIKWSDDESLCTRMVTNQIHFFDPENIGKVVSRLQLDGVSSYSISCGGAPHRIAAFVAERKGMPASIKLFDEANLSRPVNSKSFYRAQSVDFKWSPNGKSLLVQTHTDVDVSGKSYYGETGLHYLSETKTESITLGRDGPIHDLSWCPSSREFLVSYGYMPAKSTLFGTNGKPACEFGTASRNTSFWEPHGRAVCLGGFGNLQGEMDFWAKEGVKKYKRIGSAVAHCAAYYNWSPCGNYVLTAVLSPRIRVDNGYKIFSYDGSLVASGEAAELLVCMWRPASHGAFPPPEINAREISPPKQEVTKPKAYRHPNSTGSVSAALQALRQVDNSRDQTTRGTQSNTQQQQQQHLVGYHPGSKNAAKNQRRRARKRVQKQKEQPQQQQQQQQQQEQGKQTEPAAGKAASTDGEAARQKKIKTLRKKLRQIASLKEQQAEGKTLNKEQNVKVASEAQLQEELASLLAQMAK